MYIMFSKSGFALNRCYKANVAYKGTEVCKIYIWDLKINC